MGVEVGVGVGDGVGEDAVGRPTVQPATDKEATKSNRTIIAVSGFSCIRISKKRMLA